MAAVRSAKILLELVDLAPVEQIEVMLDPIVLLELLDAFGKSRDETKAALGSGTLPGELLRDLLREHGAAAVWERVPPDRKQVVPAKPASLGFLDRIQIKERPRAERYVAIAGLTVLVWSAMWMAGAFPEWGRGPGLGTAVASCLGGAACFATVTRPRSAGMLGGFVAGICNVGAAWLWVRHYPDVPVGRLVVLAIVLVPLLVGLFFSWIFDRWLGTSGAPRGF